MVSLQQTRNGAAPTIPATIDVFNPVTGERIGSIAESTRADVQAAVERGRSAQPAWAALTAKERARLVRAWGDRLWAQRDEVIAIIRSETGKTDGSALGEIIGLDANVHYLYRNAPRLLRSQRRQALFPIVQSARVYYKPHGVVGIISPWNYPLLLAFIDMLPALIAGNSVVIKPSEITPLSALHGVRLMHEYGIPSNVVQVVTGAGETGAALVDFVDYVSFTGSTAVGRKVAVRAAERLIPYSMELGGKDPLIVLKDADLDQAAAGAIRGGVENSGQVCVSTERVYVEDAIYDPFVVKLRYWADKLVCGSGDGFDVHLGSLTNEREIERCEAQITDAVSKGAQVIYGGQRRPDLGPLFFEPTVLINVDHSMRVMQEETFGPLVPVMRVRDADEAVRLANDNEYGLSGAIFSRDLKRAEQLATRIDSGDIAVNRTHVVFGTPDAPMGG
ncbi:MAG: aldehyde dehydrogenase family protein, partial [Burkholderiales bacterium]|nr:aldehyde dehydrogenase family protein [Anaerolineae bacterium]